MIVGLLGGSGQRAAAAATVNADPVHVPALVVNGLPFAITVTAGSDAHWTLSVVTAADTAITRVGTGTQTLTDLRLHRSGRATVVVTGAVQHQTKIRSIPGWLTLLPPLFAILIALAFRQVHIALFAGIWLGAFILRDFHPVAGFFYVVDHYVIDSLAGASGWDHSSIAVFTLLLGGLVGIVQANGGAAGVVSSISRLATTASRGQLATWLMGVFIFFDDYTNTLVVGNTMRPITDRLRISREKLSYIVDATAAPVACVAVITSWIGFEISLIKDAFATAGMSHINPFTTFVAAVPYSFYPLLTLAMVFFIARLDRDYGPMLRAEQRARATGRVLAPGAEPISNIDSDVSVADGVPRRWINAVLPIAVVVFGTVAGLIITGRHEAPTGTWFDALKAGNSFVALLWSSFGGCVTAMLLTIFQRIMRPAAVIHTWVSGIKAMTPAIVILVLAWSIGSVCTDLHTADYLVGSLSDVISPAILPGLIFVLAAAVSFATGTSWGTMTILTPLCIPLVVRILEHAGIAGVAEQHELLASIAAILSGAVFGDHCSPISDTTIMSSMASAADHVDHVRTQLPYALTAAGIALFTGYLPVALGVPVWFALIVSVVLVYVVVRFVGRSPELPAAH